MAGKSPNSHAMGTKMVDFPARHGADLIGFWASIKEGKMA